MTSTKSRHSAAICDWLSNYDPARYAADAQPPPGEEWPAETGGWDYSEGSRIDIAKRLNEVPLKTGRPAACSMLLDPCEAVRLAALKFLHQHPHKQCAQAIFERVNDPSQLVRWHAITAFARYQHTSAGKQMAAHLALLMKIGSPMELSAVCALGSVWKDGASLARIDRLARHRSPLVRTYAAQALYAVGKTSEALRLLREMLTHRKVEVRQGLAIAYSYCRQDDAESPLCRLTSDRSPLVRRAALCAFVSNRWWGEQFDVIAESMVTDTDPDVLRLLCRTLPHMNPSTQQKVGMYLIDNEAFPRPSEWARTLIDLGTPEALFALEVRAPRAERLQDLLPDIIDLLGVTLLDRQSRSDITAQEAWDRWTGFVRASGREPYAHDALLGMFWQATKLDSVRAYLEETRVEANDITVRRAADRLLRAG